MNTVQEAWEGYKKNVVPATAGATQLAETQQAFYSGAFIMFEFMATVSENYDEEQACHILDGVQEEIKMFLLSRAGGKT